MTEETSKKYKWVDAVSQLVLLTARGQLQWQIDSEAKTPLDDERLTAIFTSEKDGKRFRLFEVKENILDYSLVYGDLYGEKEKAFRKLIPKFRNKIMLQVVSAKGETILTFPEVSALVNLIKEVEYQVSGIDSFLENISKENGAIAN